MGVYGTGNRDPKLPFAVAKDFQPRPPVNNLQPRMPNNAKKKSPASRSNNSVNAPLSVHDRLPKGIFAADPPLSRTADVE